MVANETEIQNQQNMFIAMDYDENDGVNQSDEGFNRANTLHARPDPVFDRTDTFKDNELNDARIEHDLSVVKEVSAERVGTSERPDS